MWRRTLDGRFSCDRRPPVDRTSGTLVAARVGSPVTCSKADAREGPQRVASGSFHLEFGVHFGAG